MRGLFSRTPGWPEVTIVVRLWIIAGLLAVSAVGLFYVDWLIQA